MRWADAYLQNEDWGAIHLGFGGTSGYLTAEEDLSGTFYGGYVNVSDTDGGFSFRQSGPALLPIKAFPSGTASVPCSITVAGVAQTKCFSSPNNAFGPEVGSVRSSSWTARSATIASATTRLSGTASSSQPRPSMAAPTDIALRYGADWYGTTVVAAGAATFATSLSHSACAAYCYSSGIPSAGNAAVGQPTGLALQYGPSAAGSNQYDGSISVLHPSGLSLTVAGGVQDPIYHDPFGQSINPTLVYVKGGWLTPDPWFSFGKTAFALSYAENDDLQFKGDRAVEYAAQIAQNIDPGALQIYTAFHHQTLDRSFGTYRPIDLVLMGGVVKF